MLEASAGFIAWLGASLVVVADGRRGLALGVATSALGMAGIAWQAAGPAAALALAAGGALAAAGRLRSGAPGWRIAPPGSTPRIVLCIGAALVASWVGLVVTSGGGAGLRFAAVVALVLAPARILWSDDPDVQLSAVAVLALGAGAASAMGPSTAQPWSYVAAGLVAAAAGWLPVRPEVRDAA
ncbi:MAG TPA: hypothetical protein VFL27_04670 [Candidatus Dormibacteraeota bacterium]|nr:hypothetical protein [Candidatus Dormibacteraeota bacterium]